MYEELQKQISALAKKASEATSAVDALQYSQAACNLANSAHVFEVE